MNGCSIDALPQHFHVPFLHLPCDSPRSTIADGSAVNLNHWYYSASCTTKEDFISLIEVIFANVRSYCHVTKPLSNLKHGLSCDAFQHTVTRGQENLILDYPDIVSCPFRDVTIKPIRNCFVSTAFDSFAVFIRTFAW